MIAAILVERCTGCGDCVQACPTHVFDAGENGIPIVARLDQCQTCFMCELYCPADALYVAPEDAPVTIDTEALLASGQLGRLRHDYGWDRAPEGEGHLADFWRLGPLLREGAEIAARRYAARHEPEGAASD
jgi:NAD-dependent dihydropyrimidine dehydrogenase PreA subunit